MTKKAVHAPTGEDADRLMHAYEKKGWIAFNGEKPNDWWKRYAEETCFRFEDNFGYSSREYYKEEGYQIITVDEAIAELFPEKREFKVGDRVRIRGWDDMQKEFGLTEWGNINCNKSCFTANMKHLCGGTATIWCVDEGLFLIEDCRAELGKLGWRFSTDMLEHVEENTEPPKPKQPRYTIHPKTATLDGTTYNASELAAQIEEEVNKRNEINDWLKVARKVLTKIS